MRLTEENLKLEKSTTTCVRLLQAHVFLDASTGTAMRITWTVYWETALHCIEKEHYSLYFLWDFYSFYLYRLNRKAFQCYILWSRRCAHCVQDIHGKPASDTEFWSSPMTWIGCGRGGRAFEKTNPSMCQYKPNHILISPMRMFTNTMWYDKKKSPSFNLGPRRYFMTSVHMCMHMKMQREVASSDHSRNKPSVVSCRPRRRCANMIIWNHICDRRTGGAQSYLR